MFVDKAKIFVKAGNGGNGCTSFYRDRRIRRGKPNGGDGGNGGSIVFVADPNRKTLYDFRYNRDFRAPGGTHGSSNHKRGKNGDDLIIKVPPGTIIIDNKTKLVLRDLTEDYQRVIVCRGGKGGRGNSRSRPATEGAVAEERELSLELKIIADVGIMGYPNAGKSTLISKLSAAKSKIAAYPFTTRAPILGVIKRGEDRIVAADIPGLIEGAHQGRGLGDQFLRHVERTKLLVHLVDMAAVDQRDPVTDYQTLNRELGEYSRSLAGRKQIIVANKMDLPPAAEHLRRFRKIVKKKVYPISALTGTGTQEFVHALFREMRGCHEER